MSKSTAEKKINALVVEDDPESMEMLTLILDTTDVIHCVKATSGQEALERFKTDKFQITFLDIDIPSPNGLETLQQIKKIDAEAKVVMVTASSDINTVKNAIALGAFGYVVKPFEPEKILASIEKLSR
ncbi:MAG: response regulator [Kangiellaceae bacterium]|nr:response regulator [Kangiellaceae bacterium]MCW9017481.1 response regulator [Kangiellaceae bacterium]